MKSRLWSRILVRFPGYSGYQAVFAAALVLFVLFIAITLLLPKYKEVGTFSRKMVGPVYRNADSGA